MLSPLDISRKREGSGIERIRIRDTEEKCLDLIPNRYDLTSGLADCNQQDGGEMEETKTKPWQKELEGLKREDKVPEWEPSPSKLSPGPMWKQ